MPGCAPANLAVVQIQSGLHCLSLCLCDSRITQKCPWITSILLTESGAFKAGQQQQMHSRGLTLPVFGPRHYGKLGGPREWERYMSRARVNTKINAMPKMNQRNKTNRWYNDPLLTLICKIATSQADLPCLNVPFPLYFE